MRFTKRKMSWVDLKTDRSKVVEELFRRLVYNISDSIMYVMAETELNIIGKVLEKLVIWSQKAGMSSINRSSLPSFIIFDQPMLP